MTGSTSFLDMHLDRGLTWNNIRHPRITESFKNMLFCSQKQLLRVFRLQKKSIRIISRLHFVESYRGAFRELGLLTLPSLYILEVTVFSRDTESDFPHEIIPYDLHVAQCHSASVTLDISVGQRVHLKNWGFLALPRLPDSTWAMVSLASNVWAAKSAGENTLGRSRAGWRPESRAVTLRGALPRLLLFGTACVLKTIRRRFRVNLDANSAPLPRRLNVRHLDKRSFEELVKNKTLGHHGSAEDLAAAAMTLISSACEQSMPRVSRRFLVFEELRNEPGTRPTRMSDRLSIGWPGMNSVQP
ncbi:hypothetical protein J6590_012815 [Homalodisca vitripennis]|nr:hypothetical protein J6590_012815 [Homalodisca vitripennis]